MQSRVDAEEIDGRVLKSRARAERAAQDRRAGRDVGELPADPHDLARVCDAFEIAAMGCFPRARIFWRNGQPGAEWLKARAENERSVAPQGGIDEVLREALRLRLSANEDGDAEHDHAQTEQERAFAMSEKT